MARIKNIELPGEKHTCIGLTAIYGIGRSLALTICEDAKVEPTKKIKDLTEDEIAKYGIDAGVDIFLMPKDTKALYDYIVKGLKDGSIDEDRINQSVRRILEVKYNRGIL